MLVQKLDIHAQPLLDGMCEHAREALGLHVFDSFVVLEIAEHHHTEGVVEAVAVLGDTDGQLRHRRIFRRSVDFTLAANKQIDFLFIGAFQQVIWIVVHLIVVGIGDDVGQHLLVFLYFHLGFKFRFRLVQVVHNLSSAGHVGCSSF